MMNDLVTKHIIQKSQPITPAEVEVTQPVRIIPTSTKLRIGISLALIIAAELITDLVGVIPGVIVYSLLLITFAIFPYFSKLVAVHRISHALILIPMLRILSLVMPVPNTAPMFRYVLVGLPLLLSALVAARINHLPSIRINLTRTEAVVQFFFGISGIPLGLVASILLPRPVDIQAGVSIGTNLLLWIVMAIFVTLAEEIIFRGLLQKSLTSLFGFFSVIFSSVLYASMFIGTLSAVSVLFYGMIGLFFGLWVQFSDSLWGAIIAHSLMNLVFIVIMSLH